MDNCPQCDVERTIKLSQSRKNCLCYRCFHNQEHIIEAKRNQAKEVSDETKQKMSDNHWSKSGSYSPKGKQLSDEAKNNMSEGVKKWHVKRRQGDQDS